MRKMLGHCPSSKRAAFAAVAELLFASADVAMIALPQKYWHRLRSTNMMERLNEKIRSRKRVSRVLPNDVAVLRLIGALLAERRELWQEKIYLTWMTTTSG